MGDDLDDLREGLAQLSRHHLAPEAATWVESSARPAIDLRHTDRATRSHLGGAARLDNSHEWPRHEGRPLSLVAVLDLAELAPLATDVALPQDGVLNVFYDDATQPWGLDPEDRLGWRVVPAAADARQVTCPPGVETFASIPLEPRQGLTIPSWGESVLGALVSRQDGATAEAFWALSDRWSELRDAAHAPAHQVGGWPRLIQGSIWTECAAMSRGLPLDREDDWQSPRRAVDEDGWRLLVQIDSDERAGWMWGDVGTLYVAIPPDPAPPQGIDDGWLVLQCY